MRLTEKIATITGSGHGIGREMALLFAAEGATVVVADIDRTSADAVVSEINAAGGNAHAACVDVSNPDQVDSVFRSMFDRYGRLDILVNNAGVGLNKSFLATTLAEWERLLRVNLTGTFLCAQAAARIMVPQHSGRIVNVASISGQRGGQGRAAYGSAKAGVILLTRVMAVELAPLGIRVNALAPGPVDTDQSRRTHTQATRRAYHERIPARRYGERREIAAAALFLASDEASFIAGHVLNVDGGFQAAGLMFDPDDGATVWPRQADELAPDHPRGNCAPPRPKDRVT